MVPAVSRRQTTHSELRLIRVLVADIPPHLRNVITEVLAKSDEMTVVDWIEGESMLAALSRYGADVAILPADDSAVRLSDGATTTEILDAYPQLVLVTIGRHGRRHAIQATVGAGVNAPDIATIHVENPGLTGLLGAIRAAARPPRTR